MLACSLSLRPIEDHLYCLINNGRRRTWGTLCGASTHTITEGCMLICIPVDPSRHPTFNPGYWTRTNGYTAPVKVGLAADSELVNVLLQFQLKSQIDAGVEAWSNMRENVYKTFRFTPRTTRASILWAFVVPAFIYYGVADQNASGFIVFRIQADNASLTQNKWDWIGKRREDSLRRQNPGVQE